MSIEDKYYSQYADALKKMGMQGVLLGKIPKGEDHIFLGHMSGENITLAKALNLQISHTAICMIHILNNGLYAIHGDGEVPFAIESPHGKPIFSMREGTPSELNGNATGFKKYSENKYLSHFILGKNDVSQPRQLMFRELGNAKCSRELTEKRYENLLEFLDTLGPDKEVVIKPLNGCGGKDVFFYSVDEIKKLRNFICHDPEYVFEGEHGDENEGNEFLRCAVAFGNVLFQERIPSFPIAFEQTKKDWNLRVLTTYCPDKKKYIVAGITGRIDSDGGAINRSIGAENISLETIGMLAGWSEDEYEEVKYEVEKIAIQTTKIIASIGNRKQVKKGNESLPTTDIQNLAGIDIIISPDKKPYVIEVNDSGSGCVYELMLLKGIESILPIAASVDYKIQVFKVAKSIINDIRSQVSEDEWTHIVTEVLNGGDNINFSSLSEL